MVSHNLSSKGLQRKLLPTENVLGQGTLEEEGEMIFRGPSSKPSLIKLSVNSGAELAKIQLYRPLRPFLHIFVENAGRSAVEFVLKGSSKFIKSALVVLGDNFRLSAIALATARHLASKGIKVSILEQKLTSKECDFSTVLRDQLASLSLFPKVSHINSLIDDCSELLISCDPNVPRKSTSIFFECSAPKGTTLLFDTIVLPEVLPHIDAFLMNACISPDTLNIHEGTFALDNFVKISLID